MLRQYDETWQSNVGLKGKGRELLFLYGDGCVWINEEVGDINGFLKIFKQTLIEPAHEIMVLIIQATSEGSGQPAHPRSLTRAFIVCTHKVWK